MCNIRSSQATRASGRFEASTLGSCRADGQRRIKTQHPNRTHNKASMTVQHVMSRPPLIFEQYQHIPSSTGMRSRDEQPHTNMIKQASWRVLPAKFTRQLELLVVAYHEHAISMHVHYPASSLVARSGNGTRAKWRLQHAMTFSFRRCESGRLALVHT